jgi:hypothetical protein
MTEVDTNDPSSSSSNGVIGGVNSSPKIFVIMDQDVYIAPLQYGESRAIIDSVSLFCLASGCFF